MVVIPWFSFNRFAVWIEGLVKNKTPLPNTVTGLQLVGDGDATGEVNQVHLSGIPIRELR